MQRMMRDSNELDAYLRKGWHQMRWAKNDEKRLPLLEGVARYCQQYPRVRPLLVERLQQWSDEQLSAILLELTHFDMPHPFTQQYAEFVAFLTLTRRARLLQALEN